MTSRLSNFVAEGRSPRVGFGKLQQGELVQGDTGVWANGQSSFRQ